jgi:putative hydrolase of the HAD superfamily
MKKQTVFFDLGNVLLFFSHEKMWSQLADLTRIPLTLLRQQFAKKSAFEAYETGQLDTEQIYRTLRSLSNRSFSLLEAMRAASDIFTPNTALWPLVEQLKAQGTRLVLLSNTNECHFNFAYSHYPILKLFDEYILSYQVKACKPQPEIFRRALQEAQGKAFFTDDVPAFIKAARSSGLDAEPFTDVPTLKQHLKARDFIS